MFVASCKDDDPPPNAIVAFETTESELFENDGIIDLTIKLDKPASETIVLSFSLGGTATKLGSSGGDYDVSPDGTVTILKGESEADIEIEVFEDDDFEVDFSGDDVVSSETVIITITGVVSGPGQLGEENRVHTVSIFEDDMLVVLSWDGADSDDTDVDMDLFLWLDDPGDATDDFVLLGGSTTEGTASEGIIMPGDFPDTDFGFSYVYYAGMEDDLDFAVTFINFGGTINGDPQITSIGNYSLANINKYDEPDAPAPQIVQTTVKTGYDYIDLSSIDEPVSGSRQRVILGNFGDINPSTLKNNSTLKKIALPQGVLQRFKK
jgi:hypothetical protein